MGYPSWHLFVRGLPALAVAVAISWAVSAQDVGAYVALQRPVFEEAVRELAELAELDEADSTKLLGAFAAYRAKVEVIQGEARRAVHELGVNEEIRALADELFRMGNPIMPGESPPPDDPRWGMWRNLQSQAINAVIPHAIEQNSALRAFLGETRLLFAERQITYPRPVLFLLQSLEVTPSRNDLDPRILGMEAFYRISLQEGIIGELHERLPVTSSAVEADQFLMEIRQTLSVETQMLEEELVARHLAKPQEFKPDDAKLGVRGVTDETHRRLEQAGGRWRRAFDRNTRLIQQLAEIISAYGRPVDADRWRDEYRAAVCPAIYEERWPDGDMVQWLRDQPDATTDQLAAAEALRDAYRASAAVARERAYRASIEAASETGFVTMVFRDSTPHTACHEAILDLHLLGRGTLLQFRQLLPLSMQSRLREHWLSMSRRIAGPIPISNYLESGSWERFLDWPDMPRHWPW